MSISNSTKPKENWSERKSSAADPLACSGDMYPSVPRIVPGRVWNSRVSSPFSVSSGTGVSRPSLAKPKSRIFTVSPETIKLSGFRSRCTHRKGAGGQQFAQGFAFDQFEHQKIATFMVADVMQGADIRMSELGDRPRFVFQALALFRFLR